MGPALEGMNISCGCRAVPGAIDSVILGDDKVPQFTTIGGLAPVGICGSGLVDLVAVLVGSGLIAPSGAFNPEADKRLTARLHGDRYHLTDKVFLSQKDIRQVQLAKSAAITGILTLLSEAGRSVSDLERIIVAGSFGYHLNPESLKRIGLLPGEYTGQITFVGNSSLSGASLALLNREILREMERLAPAHPGAGSKLASGFPGLFYFPPGFCACRGISDHGHWLRSVWDHGDSFRPVRSQKVRTS